MEGYFGPSIGLVQDATYGASWHYSLRSTDGHIAQHIKTKDVAWHAGNWYVNAKSIGLEHEGFLAEGGTWYTEAMYRTSAKLVRYLALRHGVPLDRAHIIGHDNVPGTLPTTVRGMHEDPGPFWDWAHYFKLLGAPLHPLGGPKAGSVMIRPDFATNKPHFYGCDRANPEADCPPLSAGTVWLRTAPREDAPLVKDIGKHPTGELPLQRVRPQRQGEHRPALRGGRAAGRLDGDLVPRPEVAGSTTRRPRGPPSRRRASW